MKTFYKLIILSLLFTSCKLDDDFTKEDSPTSGKLILYYDEGLTLHIENQIKTFQATYGYADIQLVSSDEKASIENLFKDSCKAIAISRALTEEELKKFHSKNILPQSSLVAKTGIAIVVNKNFSDSTISIPELVELLKGNDSSYVKGSHLSVVFSSVNSGCTRQLKDSLIPNNSFGKNCSASNNTIELIKSITTNSNVIGICDFAWLSDKDDDHVKEFMKSVKVLAVSKKEGQTAYMPDQSNLATMDYPLTRNMYIIRRSAEFSLGKGVETFIAGPNGQLMFLKQGLAPNRQEERVIEIDMVPLTPEK